MNWRQLKLRVEQDAGRILTFANTQSVSLTPLGFDRLFGALIGVAIGAFIAIAIACAIFPPPSVAYDPASLGTLEWVKGWAHQEQREKAFYALSLLFGGGLGVAGAWLRIGGSRPTLLSLLLMALIVPVATIFIGIAIVSKAALALVLGLTMATLIAGGAFVLGRRQETAGDVTVTHAILLRTPDQPVEFKPTWGLGITAVALLAVFIVPVSAGSIAATIGFNMHMASFIVGPATYSFGSGLVPGIDYFTQYSVGTPWLFSFMLAPTATKTMVNAVRLVVAEILFFEVTLFFFLWWFFRSWMWAFITSIVVLMVQFTTATPLYAPSSTAARYPLIMLAATLFVFWVKRHLSLSSTIPLALALAGSLFLGTETGLYTCGAVGLAAIVAVPTYFRSFVRVSVLAAMTIVFFALLNLIAFGPRVITVDYLRFLIEPLILYSSGLGAWSIEWTWGYHWFYVIISPALALASVGWVAVVSREKTPPADIAHLAAVAMVSCVGLFLTAKFINMSIVALWQVNSAGLLIVCSWWARTLIAQLENRPLLGGRIALRPAATYSLLAVTFVFLLTITDPRNPSLYAFKSYRTHPSLVNYLLGGPAVYPCEPACASVPVSSQDVALIKRLTHPDERVALLMLQDWPTLIEVRRASKFYFLPSALTFTERQMTQSLRNIDLIFLPREPVATLGITNTEMARTLVPMLRDKFSVVAETPTLLAWKRVR